MVQYGAEPYREVERAGSGIHPRFRQCTCLPSPAPNPPSPAIFGKSLGRGAARCYVLALVGPTRIPQSVVMACHHESIGAGCPCSLPGMDI